MTNARTKMTSCRQRGIALIAVMITLLFITAITAGMIILATTETNTSANFRDEQRAFFSAKAGVEEIRDRLRSTATDTLRTAGVLPTTLPGGNKSVLYILNPLNGETVAPWASNYPDVEICKENTTIACFNGLPTGGGWYNSAAASTTYAANPVLDWKWVRITLKQNNTIAPYYTNGSSATTSQVCWNGNNEYADPVAGCTPPNLPVYMVTALAVTPSGSRRMVQAELAEDRLNFTPASALTLDGLGETGAFAFAGGSSNNWGVNGNDTLGCGSTTTGAPVHAIGVPDTGDVGPVSAGASRPKNYTGSGGTTPDVANVSGQLAPDLQTVSGLQSLMSNVLNDATQPVLNCQSGCSGLSNPGTVNAPQIIYVNGNLTLTGNTTGYGILAVTGTLNIKGTINWNGLILVIGQGNFQTSGTPSYNGAVVVANTLNALGQPLTTLGPATFQVNGGGNGGVQYSSGCVAQATTLSTFHVTAIRELMD